MEFSISNDSIIEFKEENDREIKIALYTYFLFYIIIIIIILIVLFIINMILNKFIISYIDI